MEVWRTVRVRLEVPPPSAALLNETVDEFRFVANFVIDHAWQDDGSIATLSTLQGETYEAVRSRTPLNSALVQNAQRRAVEALASALGRRKKGFDAGKPTFSRPTVRYDHRAMTFFDEHVALATTGDRVTASFVMPRNMAGTPHERYLRNEAFEVKGADLLYESDHWALHVRTKRTADPEPPEWAATEPDTVLGVDLGVTNIAVTSTGRFWSGSELRHWQQAYKRRRAMLQECGSRSAHESLKSVGRKETGRITTKLHRVSNELVEEALETRCSVIVFEDLTDIRERTNDSWGHVWCFRRLIEYTRYKARERGLHVEEVNPEGTSIRCSTCGFTHPDNRRKQQFHCSACGYQNHADYNASKNIGLRYLHRHQNGDDGGAPLGVRLNSGLLSASGDEDGFSPIDDVAADHAETTDGGW